jgi:hypothetical protein
LKTGQIEVEGNSSLFLEYSGAVSRLDVSIQALASLDLAAESWSTDAIIKDGLQPGDHRSRFRARIPLDSPSQGRFLRLQESQQGKMRVCNN